MLYLVGVHYKYVRLKTVNVQDGFILAPYMRQGFSDFMQTLTYIGFDVYSTAKHTHKFFKTLEFARFLTNHTVENVKLSSAADHELLRDLANLDKQTLYNLRLQFGQYPASQDMDECSDAMLYFDEDTEYIGLKQTESMFQHTLNCMSFNQYTRFGATMCSGKLQAKLVGAGIVITDHDEENETYDYITWDATEHRYIEVQGVTVADINARVHEGYTLANATFASLQGYKRLMLADALNEHYQNNDSVKRYIASASLLATESPWRLKQRDTDGALVLLSINWDKLKDKDKMLFIPDGITAVAPHAFANVDLPEMSVVLPTSLQELGQGAFEDAHLKRVVLYSVKDIGDGAFKQAKFDSLIIGFGLQHIGNNAFEAMTLADNGVLQLPQTVETVGIQAFLNAHCTVEYARDSVVYIGEEAHTFSSLKEIPHGVLYIGGHAFTGCTFAEDGEPFEIEPPLQAAIDAFYNWKHECRCNGISERSAALVQRVQGQVKSFVREMSRHNGS